MGDPGESVSKDDMPAPVMEDARAAERLDIAVAISSAEKTEAEWKARLQRLEREARRLSREGALRESEARKREQGAALRALLDQKELRDKLVGVRPADEDALRRFSEACNMRLCELHEPSKRMWIRLFRRVDRDGSGLIDYAEFVSLVRAELTLGDDFDDLDVKRMWVALDTDDSGRLSQEEFSKFMRLGEHVLVDQGGGDGKTWKEKLHAAKQKITRQCKADRDALFHRHIAREVLSSGVVTSASDLRRMSEAFNARLRKLRDTEAGFTSWFHLFKRVDVDGSGQIDFSELRQMVREGLSMSPSRLSEDALKALWVTLDKDGSGYISAGEFGSFIRLSEPPMITLAERRARLAKKAQLESHSLRCAVLSLRRDKAKERAQNYEQRVAALEKQIGTLEGSGTSTPSASPRRPNALPPIGPPTPKASGPIPKGGSDPIDPAFSEYLRVPTRRPREPSSGSNTSRSEPTPRLKRPSKMGPTGAKQTVLSAYSAVIVPAGGVRSRVGGGAAGLLAGS